jgi:small subunit ribosomal protein S13
MIYIFESDIPENKSVYTSLTSIYGIGKYRSKLLCKILGLSLNFTSENLSKEQINKLIKTVELLSFSLSSDLKKIKVLISKKLISIKSYKGLRHYQGLPVRGQRTHTNAKTAKKIR